MTPRVLFVGVVVATGLALIGVNLAYSHSSAAQRLVFLNDTGLSRNAFLVAPPNTTELTPTIADRPPPECFAVPPRPNTKKLDSTRKALASVPLTLLQEPADARCMDGSPGGFYHRPAAALATATKWVISLPAGGSCDSERSCGWSKGGPLSSSNFFPSAVTRMDGPASASCSDNPRFCSWNHVLVGYCSQDFLCRTRTDPSPGTMGTVVFWSAHC